MKKKILFVEDDVETSATIKTFLEANNYEVTTALDGEDGLRMAKETSPDLILLDLMLPKMSGFVMARLIKFDERYKNMPIIIISARARQEDVALGKKIGACEYLIKPIKLEVLLDKIKTALLPHQE